MIVSQQGGTARFEGFRVIRFTEIYSNIPLPVIRVLSFPINTVVLT